MSARQLPDPAHSAVVTMELQRGIVGDLATLRELAKVAVDNGTLEASGELCRAARRSGVPVVHAVVSWHPDRRGTILNTPLAAALARNPQQILEGTEAVDLVPELGDTSADLLARRHHGLTPFTGTDLDMLLRSLGVESVIACGVSLNVGVLGLCLGAADLGYRVTVCSDAVIGSPVEYGHAVLENSIAMVASVLTVGEVIEHWG